MLLPGYGIVVAVWLIMVVKFALPIAKSVMNSNDKTKITVFAGLVTLGFSYLYRLLHLSIYYANG